MKFECPICKKSGQVDDSKVPEDGVNATCPQCHNKFLIKREPSDDFLFDPVAKSAPKATNTTPPVIPQQSSPQQPIPQPAIKPAKPPESQNKSPYSSTEGKPWRRFWARSIDMILIGLPIVYSVIFIFRELIFNATESNRYLIIAIIALPLFILFESIILGASGTTFGKWLLNIKIVSKRDNQNISFLDALKRTVLLWVKGLGFGLPIINLIPMVFAARRIKKNGTASWDDSISAIVQCSPVKAFDVVFAVLTVLALLFVNGIASELAPSLIKPKQKFTPGWASYYSSPESTSYIDNSSIIKSGPHTIRLNTMLVILSGEAEGVKNYSTYEVNCSEIALRRLESITVHKDGQTSTEPARADFSFLQPDKPFYRVAVDACAIANVK